MSTIPTTTSRRFSETREQLHDGVRWTAQRGRLLASVGALLRCAAALVAGLFVVALVDVLFVLPDLVRSVLLFALLIVAGSAAIMLALRPWLDQQFNKVAGQQIDQAAERDHQPVTVGLTLNEPTNDDTLSLKLLERAEARAANVAQSIKPSRAYPLRLLMHPGSWLLQTLGLWLLLAIIVPSQVLAIASRVLLPWGDAPPFSLTQLDPTWSPMLPNAGEDVVVSVEPAGLMPESVDWVRLDEQGDEAERFAMVADGLGGFSLLLKRIESPIDFKLEANGRHTRTYTITPTPRPPTVIDDTQDDGAEDATDTSDGSLTYDPDKVAKRDLESHRDWPDIKAKLQKLLDELAEAQAAARAIDPADAKVLQGLADKLAELTAKAKAIAGEITAMQGDLPADASAMLDQLRDALTTMQSASLPAPPDHATIAPGSGEPTPAQWLKQAGDAAQADQQQIGQGLGPSDQPTDSGTNSGTPGDGPDLRDPGTTGTTTELNPSGNEGPLPDSVMQQIPPSYRGFVSAYFEKLAGE